ncbi:glutamate receptor ionotropic: NMDA 2B-like protein, partial [Dinothrombium tinctorium]
FNILDIFTVKGNSTEKLMQELKPLADSEARVILLYSTKMEAQVIMAAAKELGLTGKNYMWIVSQSVVGTASENFAPNGFPPGMLGK